MERIKQIIRTLQPAAEIVECDYAEVDLNKIINTGLFDFERTATSAGWIRGIEGVLTEEQKREAEERGHHHHHEEHEGDTHHAEHDEHCHHHHEGGEVEEYGISTLFTIVVLRSIFISSTILLLPNGAVILSVLRGMLL